MSKTVRRCIYGSRPPCYNERRLEERRVKKRQSRYFHEILLNIFDSKSILSKHYYENYLKKCVLF